MPDLKQYSSNGSLDWAYRSIEQMGEESFRRYINSVYAGFDKMKVGKFIDLTVLQPQAQSLFVKAAELFMRECNTTLNPRRWEFSRDYTKIWCWKNWWYKEEEEE